jgi:hypothetical protein
MQPEVSLSCLQEPSTHVLSLINPIHTFTFYLSKVLVFLAFSFLLTFPLIMCMYSSPNSYHFPCHLILLYLIILIILNERFSKITKNKQTNPLALSPQANYTDWATTTCRRNLVPTFADRGVSRGQRGGSPTVVKSQFLKFNYSDVGQSRGIPLWVGLVQR